MELLSRWDGDRRAAVLLEGSVKNEARTSIDGNSRRKAYQHRNEYPGLYGGRRAANVRCLESSIIFMIFFLFLHFSLFFDKVRSPPLGGMELFEYLLSCKLFADNDEKSSFCSVTQSILSNKNI